MRRKGTAIGEEMRMTIRLTVFSDFV